LVALEFALALLTDGLNRMINLTDSLLGDLFSNYTSIRIMKHAATLDLDQFEDSVLNGWAPDTLVCGRCRISLNGWCWYYYA
jgi:hypothetical protein